MTYTYPMHTYALAQLHSHPHVQNLAQCGEKHRSTGDATASAEKPATAFDNM